MNKFIVSLATVFLAAMTFPTAAQTTLQKAERDELFRIQKNDPDMAAAMEKARATLPEFLATMRTPKDTMGRFAVKIAIRDGNEREFFWISSLTEKDGSFSGRLGNTPRSVKNVKEGQTITFKQDEIVDWTYIDGKRTRGNFTACPLLKREPPAQAKAMMERFGIECDF